MCARSFSRANALRNLLETLIRKQRVYVCAGSVGVASNDGCAFVLHENENFIFCLWSYDNQWSEWSVVQCDLSSVENARIFKLVCMSNFVKI